MLKYLYNTYKSVYMAEEKIQPSIADMFEHFFKIVLKIYLISWRNKKGTSYFCYLDFFQFKWTGWKGIEVFICCLFVCCPDLQGRYKMSLSWSRLCTALERFVVAADACQISKVFSEGLGGLEVGVFWRQRVLSAVTHWEILFNSIDQLRSAMPSFYLRTSFNYYILRLKLPSAFKLQKSVYAQSFLSVWVAHRDALNSSQCFPSSFNSPPSFIRPPGPT